MKVKTNLLILLLLANLSIVPFANALTGWSLFEYCKDAVEKNFTTLHAGSCASTIDTTRKMLDKYQEHIVGRTNAVCFSDEVNSADGLVQLVRVVLQYLEGNPGSLNLEAWGLVVVALVEAFPCND